MNTTELEQAIRNSTFIGDAAAFTEFTTNRVLLEANDKKPWYLVGYVVFASLVSMASALAIGRRERKVR